MQSLTRPGATGLNHEDVMPIPDDLTALKEFDLHQLSLKEGVSFVELRRRQAEQQAAAALAQQEDERLAKEAAAEAARRALRTFKSADDLLERLPPAPVDDPRLDALGLKSLDGKAYLANEERLADLERRQEEERRTELEAMSKQLDVTVDELLKMDPETRKNRAAMSAAQGDLTVRADKTDWQENEKRIPDEYGVNLKAVNRGRGSTHPRKRKRKQ